MHDLYWLLSSSEPWTRYRTRIDLLEQPETDPQVNTVRQEMLAHPGVQGLMSTAANFTRQPIQRHNDASHPIHSLSVLADFGVRGDDLGMTALVEMILSHQASHGAFQSLVNISTNFGGSGTDQWAWMLCDTPVLLYCLLSFGLGKERVVQQAVEHLVSLAGENGWGCRVAAELGRFRGPGRKADPCPIANVIALKALALVPELLDSPVVRHGTEMLLDHWENRGASKMYLFGIGTDFRKLKYPFIWYDILHVAEVLSRFPYVHDDPRFQEIVSAITAQADEEDRYTAASMYQAWKGWSFADKKAPSPWLTFLVWRLLKRIAVKRASLQS